MGCGFAHVAQSFLSARIIIDQVMVTYCCAHQDSLRMQPFCLCLGLGCNAQYLVVQQAVVQVLRH